MDYKKSYQYDPAQLPRQRELRDKKFSGVELTKEEKEELTYLTFSQMSFLMDRQAGN